MRILYHAVNGTGLGHLMRTTAVAAHVRRLRADTEQLIVTNASFSAHARHAGIPTLNLPLDDSGPFAAVDRRLTTVDRGLSGRIIEAIAREYAPDAIVFDTYVETTLAKRLSAGRRAALIFRESREDYARWCAGELFPAMDRVIVPHHAADFFAGLSGELAAALRAQPGLRCVGPVVYPESLDDTDVQATLARYRIAPEQKLILIACGSGGYDFLAHPFLDAAARAAAELARSSLAVRVLCVAGPYGEPARGVEGAELVPWEARFQHLLRRAEVVIAHGGYNTVQEVLRTGARAILVPVPRKTEDQAQRLRDLARRGRIRVLERDAPLERFHDAIAAALAEPRPAPEPVEGGEAAARAILELGSGALAPVRVAWPEVPRLAATIGRGSIEVLLGHGSVPELERRARASLEVLRESGLAADRTTLELIDLEGGECFAGLVEQLRDCQFKLLLARVPPALAQNRLQLFGILERCRGARPGFRYDLTSQALDP
jgi:UDP-N-acetylglucosamine--N-acetylmuramyl-(pentapeptide) pyrophosphoryl-undecaprenol N-acetylglucosamine transferase